MAYTDQEKSNIITQYKQGCSAQDLSKKYGVCERTIYRWAKKYCGIVPGEKRALTAKEYDTLLRRIERLENIVAILNGQLHCPCPSKRKTA